ncbi:M48 family metallopeptidase [Eubacterium aggregans]|uniref:M48 family metallopeptidase n=1 Tax=Eubacterium aggregans TaxID=81409 RepID=UPI003F2B0769
MAQAIPPPQRHRVMTPAGEVVHTLIRKSVKNINLHIHPDGHVAVSAGPRVSLSKIDGFVASKGAWIVEKLSQRTPDFEAEASPPDAAVCRPVFEALITRYYPFFKARGVAYPTLRIKTMKSRWGSCISGKGVITLNTRLLTKPMAAVEYVVVHELAHFLVQNHQADFYAVVAQVLPDYKARRKFLK